MILNHGKKEIQKAIKTAEKIKPVKATMTKNKLKSVVNKALAKAVKKAGKKEKAKILEKKKRKLLFNDTMCFVFFVFFC